MFLLGCLYFSSLTSVALLSWDHFVIVRRCMIVYSLISFTRVINRLLFQSISKQRDQILKELSALQEKKDDQDTKKVRI